MKETAYLLQATLVSVWWIGLTVSDRFFAAFQFDGLSPLAFWSFFGPDMVLIAGLSIWRTYVRNRTVELIVLGAFAYATLYCLNATLLTGSGYLSTGLMVLGLGYNVFLCFGDALFRVATTGLWSNAWKTGLQVVCAWGLALVVLPYVLLDAFSADMNVRWGWHAIAGAGLLLVCSALGLASAFWMVRDGNGTPLPLDQPKSLVTSGPYRFVRNPMAVAGIGQGIAVAIVFQSVVVFVYALLGAVVWQWVIRPVEEQDMMRRFGEAYCRYQASVPCWLPVQRGSRRYP